MDSWRRMTVVEETRRFLIKWLIALGIHFIYTSCRHVNASLDAEVIRVNVSAQGLYNSEPPVYPLKATETGQSSRDTHGALFLICGVILGVPLGVLAVCGVRDISIQHACVYKPERFGVLILATVGRAKKSGIRECGTKAANILKK